MKVVYRNFDVEQKSVQRFLSVDPLVEETMDAYGYCYNNPVNLIDPDGMSPENGDGGDPPKKDKSSFLKGWNLKVQEFNNNFYSEVNKLGKGFDEVVDKASQTIVDTAQPIFDLLGITEAMGFENKTAKAIDNLVTTVQELPNMTNEQKGAAAAALTVVVVEGVVTKKVSNPVSKVKSIAEQAQDLKKLNGGKNSVTINTSNGKTRYDLDGKAHGGVETPHKQSYKNNVVNGEVKSVTRTSKTAQSMNQQDIRVVRKTLEKRNNN